MFKRILNRLNRAKEGERLSEFSIENAVNIIERHGMKAHFYLASIGNRDNEELSYALDTLEAAGFIVTD